MSACALDMLEEGLVLFHQYQSQDHLGHKGHRIMGGYIVWHCIGSYRLRILIFLLPSLDFAVKRVWHIFVFLIAFALILTPDLCLATVHSFSNGQIKQVLTYELIKLISSTC